MTTDIDVRCQRCGAQGGTAYRGWMLLCARCVHADEEWYEDQQR